jgi:hypothetical protein
MTKKRAKSPKPEKSSAALKADADRIVRMWRDTAVRAMGGKRFAPEVLNRYEPRLRTNIVSKLKDGEVFDAKAKANTKKVATDLGKVCAMFTTGKTVSKDTFQTVFFMMKTHPSCPQKKIGAGVWCDVPL